MSPWGTKSPTLPHCILDVRSEGQSKIPVVDTHFKEGRFDEEAEKSSALAIYDGHGLVLIRYLENIPVTHNGITWPSAQDWGCN
jgi:hypothetical protein